MIRFRFQDDERRFVKLHSEMFSKLARAGFSEVAGSELLRNVSKIEQMAFLEGIRQGLAMAALAQQMTEQDVLPIPEPHSHKAFQLHALIYGSSDTPLRSIEKEWLSKLGLEEDHLAKSWLDDRAMRFAPATLQELDGTAPPIAPMVSIQAPSKPTLVRPIEMPTDPIAPPPDDDDDPLDRLPSPMSMHGAEVTVPEPWQKGEYEPDDPDPTPRDETPAEAPDFLDRVRDEIQVLKRTGWDPKNWQEIVLGLHRHMSVDAGYIDIQLTTHVGRTVLDQCGLAGMAPPDMISMDFFTALPSQAAEPSPTLVTASETDDNDIPF